MLFRSPIAALRVSRFCHWGFRCLRASGEVDSGGRAKKLLLVWSSSERGIWYARATKEDGTGGQAVSGGKWYAADDGEERRKKKRGGRRVEDGEESAFNLNSTSTTTRIYRPLECK